MENGTNREGTVLSSLFSVTMMMMKQAKSLSEMYYSPLNLLWEKTDDIFYCPLDQI